jgi:hypothetical protein
MSGDLFKMFISSDNVELGFFAGIVYLTHSSSAYNFY